MFYFLSKVLDLLLAPLTWAILLPAAAVALRRRRAAPWLAGAGAAILWLFSVEPVANALSGLAERGVRSTLRPDVTYDAVVVLGGFVDPGASRTSGETELSPAAERFLAGLELFRSGRARNILLSAGGPDPGEGVEADWAGALYRRLGVPADRLILERESRNTRENAERTAAIVRERGLRSLALVTSAMHAPRAVAAFRRVGLDVDLLAVDHRYGDREFTLQPRVDALERSTASIRELAGRVAYRLAGYAGS